MDLAVGEIQSRRKHEEPGYRGSWKLDFRNALPQQEILKRKNVAIFVLKELGLIVRQSDKFPRGSCKLKDDQISCVETELTPHPVNFQATASLSFIIRNHHCTLFLTGINIPLVKVPAPGSCGFKSSLNTVAH